MSVQRFATCLLALALLPACSPRQLVVTRIGDALAEGGAVYASDDDLELVGAATPFGLKLMESLLAEAPAHRGLLLAAARGFTQYAYAYVENPADELGEREVAAAYTARERARRLYLRARDYGLRGLDAAHPGLPQRLQEAPAAALAATRREDVALLYWTASAWGAAVALAKDDAALLADLPRIAALAQRALELDEAFDGGALHVLHISLAINQPGPSAARVAAARRHYERALALSAGQAAAPHVAYAEAVAMASGNREEFARTLTQALAVDGAAVARWRLANTLFQRRARWLLAHTDQFFAE